MSPSRHAPIVALATRVVHRLAEAGGRIAVAESCTGGWLGAALTAVPGASAVFWGGFIAYDDEAKLDLLGVDAATLRDQGAVSEEVAVAMARGIQEASGVTWGVGITGVAGPSGGTARTPVGTVFVALHGPKCLRRALRLQGDRESIRRQSVATALSMVAEGLSGDA